MLPHSLPRVIPQALPYPIPHSIPQALLRVIPHPIPRTIPRSIPRAIRGVQWGIQWGALPGVLPQVLPRVLYRVLHRALYSAPVDYLMLPTVWTWLGFRDFALTSSFGRRIQVFAQVGVSVLDLRTYFGFAFSRSQGLRLRCRNGVRVRTTPGLRRLRGNLLELS